MSEHPLRGGRRGRGSTRHEPTARWTAELVRDACVEVRVDPHDHGLLYMVKLFVCHPGAGPHVDGVGGGRRGR